jgi:hypothetical protein
MPGRLSRARLAADSDGGRFWARNARPASAALAESRRRLAPGILGPTLAPGMGCRGDSQAKDGLSRHFQ